MRELLKKIGRRSAGHDAGDREQDRYPVDDQSEQGIRNAAARGTDVRARDGARSQRRADFGSRFRAGGDQRQAIGSEPTGEQIDAALKQMTSAGAPLPGTEDEGSSDEKHIAALMARDRGWRNSRLSKGTAAGGKIPGSGGGAADTAPAPAAAPAPKKSAERKAEAAETSDPEVKTIGSKPTVGELLTSPKYSKYVMIGACGLIAVALFFVWRAMHVPTVQDNFQIASATPANPVPAAQPPASSAMPRWLPCSAKCCLSLKLLR